MGSEQAQAAVLAVIWIGWLGWSFNTGRIKMSPGPYGSWYRDEQPAQFTVAFGVLSLLGFVLVWRGLGLTWDQFWRFFCVLTGQASHRAEV